MSSNAAWQQAFVAQASADFALWQQFSSIAAPIRTCHRLMILQMTCEKLAKAYLYSQPTTPDYVSSSHAVIAKHLPTLFREIYQRINSRSAPRHWSARIHAICREIELLSPSVKAGGQHQQNCEYPWQHGGSVHVPANYAFPEFNPTDPIWQQLIKMIPVALAELRTAGDHD